MSANTHSVTPEEILALIDGELPDAKRKSIASHVEACTECRAIAGALRSTSRSVAAWSVPPFQSTASFGSTLKKITSEASANPFLAQPSTFATFLRRHWSIVLASALVLFVLFMSNAMYMKSVKVARRQAVDLTRPDNALDLPDEGRDGLYVRKIPEPAINGTVGKPEAETKVRAGTMAGAIGGVRDADKYEPSPMIARTLSLAIIAKDFTAARASLDLILARHHGYAASLTANTQQNSARSLQASLRIPAPELNAALAELKSLGHIESEGQGGEEVTQQHADLVARIKNSRETEQRLQEVLRARTGKIKDVLEVEQEIARVRGEIEQMEAEQKSLEHRVDFASIDLRLTEEYKAQLGSPSPSVSTRFHNAFVTGYKDAVETLISILLFFAEYGPSLLVWLALFLPVGWLVWRRWRRNYLVSSSVSAQ